jgi:hypothetical protein
MKLTVVLFAVLLVAANAQVSSLADRNMLASFAPCTAPLERALVFLWQQLDGCGQSHDCTAWDAPHMSYKKRVCQFLCCTTTMPADRHITFR